MSSDLPSRMAAQGILGPELSWRRWDFPHDQPGEFGAWALRTHLHSRGSDFTSPGRDYENPGFSSLRRLWSGNASDPHLRASAWVLFRGNQPVGVAAWESALGEDGGWQAGSLLAGRFRSLGRLSLWVNSMHRGRGLMGGLLDLAVVPELMAAASACQKEETPFIRAADASVAILSSRLPITVLPNFSPRASQDVRMLREMSAKAATTRPRLR